MTLLKKNLILTIIIIIICVIPLIFIVDGEFEGADGMAGDLIGEIAPEYKPWVESIYEPESGEIESMLFSLQAASGAGVIGFILGRMTGKQKQKGKQNDGN